LRCDPKGSHCGCPFSSFSSDLIKSYLQLRAHQENSLCLTQASGDLSGFNRCGFKGHKYINNFSVAKQQQDYFLRLSVKHKSGGFHPDGRSARLKIRNPKSESTKQIQSTKLEIPKKTKQPKARQGFNPVGWPSDWGAIEQTQCAFFKLF